MAITVADFAIYVNDSQITTDEDKEALAFRALEAARQLVHAGYRIERIPEAVLDQALLQVASELWIRRDNPGGIVQAAFEGGLTSRLSRDALTSVRPMLATWRRVNLR